MKKIVAVDFDGTLVNNKYPFIENPNNDLLEFIRKNRKKYIWILWTMREGKQLDYATKWLKEEQGIVFDYVNDNCKRLKREYKNNPRKIYADYYIDDHNVLIGDLLNGI